MPRRVIFENKISASDLQFRLAEIFREKTLEFILTDVRNRYKYDENRNRTEVVEAVVYTVIELNSFSTFDVKVPATVPVITQEDLEQAEERVFVEIPLEETFVRPYKMEYGTATVSIVAPYITLASAAVEADEK